MIDKKHPTHAVRHISNWDGEHDVLTSLCVLDETTGAFHYWDGGNPVLEYVGDEILHAWALTDQMADTIRNARRYLALRRMTVTLVSGDAFCFAGKLEELDAAADRLMEGGE